MYKCISLLYLIVLYSLTKVLAFQEERYFHWSSNLYIVILSFFNRNILYQLIFFRFKTYLGSFVFIFLVTDRVIGNILYLIIVRRLQ